MSTFWSVPTSVYSASVLIGSLKVDRLEGLPDEAFVVVVTL